MSLKFGVFLLLAVSGCAAAPFNDDRQTKSVDRFAFEIGSTETISKAPAPSQADWFSFDVVHIGDGRRDRIQITAFGASGIRGRFSDGCLWTRQTDWFSPSDSWAFCGDSRAWRTAQATVVRRGSLWPLALGATAEYVRDARSAKTGETSRRTTVCRVIDAVDVRRSSGAIEPAYKVRCDDNRRVRTTWWSPTAGLLFYRQEHRTRGLERFWERVGG